MSGHSEIGPSGAHRWMACPGSVEAERGLPDSDSVHSREGTTAHALAEMAFQRNRPCEAWLGDEIEGVAVDGEMAEHVQTYVDALRDYAEGAEIVEIEAKLDLAPLRPPAPMHGTSDAWFWYPTSGLLRVVDLKYGRGVVVEAEGNPQLRYYALMAWVRLATLAKAKAAAVKEVEVVVIQPRAFHPDGPIRVERFPLADLKVFGRDLLLAAKRVHQPNPPRVAGEHCRFCRAKLTCGEFRGKALAVAQVEFDDVAEGEAMPPDPAALTPAQLGTVLANADILEAWLKVVKARVLHELESGRPVPGWALKPKRANRQWADEERVWPYARRHGLKKAELYETKLKSPAQAEKALKGVGATLPEEMTVRVSSGYTLCADTDPKALIPEAEFQVLDNPEEPSNPTKEEDT